jgi:hypothetical protein
MSTATETLEQEYDRLADEQAEISARRRTTGASSPEDVARYVVVTRRLREILTTPPTGYGLPKPLAELVAYAEAHGWLTLVQWTPPGWADEVFVKTQVGRRLTEAEQQAGDYYSDRWLFELTYHSRDCAPGAVRKFGPGGGYTPDRRAAERAPAPSLKAIRAVIAAHPAPEAVGAA